MENYEKLREKCMKGFGGICFLNTLIAHPLRSVNSMDPSAGMMIFGRRIA